MRITTPIYVKIFEDLRLRFFCGTYQLGDRFPACAALCREYGVSDRTMRQAVQLLVKNGFIETAMRKAPVVIYEYGRQALKPAPTLSAQELAELLDVVDTMDLIYPNVLAHCIPLCDGEDRIRLASMRKAMSENLDLPGVFTSLAKRFWDIILEKSKNRLVLHFFSQLRPLAVPFHSSSRAERESYLAFVEDILARLETGSGLEQINYQKYNAQFRRALCALYDGGPGAPPVSEGQDLYLEETLYQSVYMDLLRRTQEGEFKKGEYFPSRAKLCSQYGISGITAAHAVKKLREMGVAESVRGRGVRLLMSGEQIGGSFDRELLVRQARKFAESMEMLMLTSESAARHAVEKVDGLEAVTFYNRMLERSGAETKTCLPGLLLRFITERLRLKTVENLYKKMEENFYMGFQFRNLLPEPRPEDTAGYTRMCLEAAKNLAAGRRRDFAWTVSEVYRSLFDSFIRACGEKGILDEVRKVYEKCPSWDRCL